MPPNHIPQANTSGPPGLLIQLNPDRSGVFYFSIPFPPISSPNQHNIFGNPGPAMYPAGPIAPATAMTPTPVPTRSGPPVSPLVAITPVHHTGERQQIRPYPTMILPMREQSLNKHFLKSSGPSSNVVAPTRPKKLEPVPPKATAPVKEIPWRRGPVPNEGLYHGSEEMEIADSEKDAIKKQKSTSDGNKMVDVSAFSATAFETSSLSGSRGVGPSIPGGHGQHKVVRRIMTAIEDEPFQKSPLKQWPYRKNELPSSQEPKSSLTNDVDNPISSAQWLQNGIRDSPFQTPVSLHSMSLHEAWESLQIVCGNWRDPPPSPPSRPPAYHVHSMALYPDPRLSTQSHPHSPNMCSSNGYGGKLTL
jgi:hypothetical protein